MGLCCLLVEFNISGYPTHLKYQTSKWLSLVQHCVFFPADSRLLSKHEDLLTELECPSLLLPQPRCCTTTSLLNKSMFHHSVAALVSFLLTFPLYENDGSAKKFFVSSGTVTINEDSTAQLLAEEAVPVENLDMSAAKDLLNQAQGELASASTEVAKAEAQIAIEVSEALVKACE